jgi:hypothetical protein
VAHRSYARVCVHGMSTVRACMPACEVASVHAWMRACGAIRHGCVHVLPNVPLTPLRYNNANT